MKNKSFTLIEVLVVISIIVILTGIVFAGYRSGQKQLALQRSANKLAQDIRRVQEMAMAAEELPSGEVPYGGYGVYLENDDNSYIIYADNNGDRGRGSGDTDIETIYLEEGVSVSDLLVSHVGSWGSKTIIAINFIPPDPEVSLQFFLPLPIGWFPGDGARIVLALESDPSKTKTITVNKVGLIEID